MLKILISESTTQCLLVLRGQLAGVGVSGLMHICATSMTRLHKRHLVIDMEQVTAVSQEAENFLLKLVTQGARIRAHGVLATGILRQLARRSNRQMSELIDTSPVITKDDGVHITLGGVA